MNTLIYCIGYDKTFITNQRTGWGCGYVMIPINHPFLRAMIAEQARLAQDPNYCDWGYLQIPNFSEEITLDELETVNGIEYRRLGFDMAHLHNNIEMHDRAHVLAKTMEMQRIVESYK